MNDIELLNKMTIVMPTYERPEFALRNMSFWSGSQLQLLVLDGSKLKISELQLGKFGDNVRYIHLPISMAERLRFAKNLINTEYVSLLGDDEFLLPSGILACIKEIKKEDLIACLGRSLFFKFKDNKIFSESLNHETGSPWHPGFKNYNVLQSKPAQRVNFHMNPYLSTTCYAVTNSVVWKRSIDAFQNMQSSADCPEIALELSNAFQGKSKVIDQLMWLRSGENDPMMLYGKREDYITFGRWYDNPKFDIEKHIFIEIIVDSVYSDNVSIPKNSIYKIIQSGCESFALFERTRRFGFKGWFVNESSQISFVALRYYLTKMIRRVFEKLKIVEREDDYFDKYDTTLYGRACAWKDAGIGVDLDEIKLVSDLITNFHKDLNKAI